MKRKGETARSVCATTPPRLPVVWETPPVRFLFRRDVARSGSAPHSCQDSNRSVSSGLFRFHRSVSVSVSPICFEFNRNSGSNEEARREEGKQHELPGGEARGRKGVPGGRLGAQEAGEGQVSVGFVHRNLALYMIWPKNPLNSVGCPERCLKGDRRAPPRHF